MWDFPRGILKSAIDSGMGALPTFTGLGGWGKRVNCLLCGNLVKQTLFHVLVHCKHTLVQGRLTWRHDTVLNHMSGSLGSALVGGGMVELSNRGWVCSLYLIKVGARGHIVKSVGDHLRSLFRAWLPAGHGSGVGQMMGDVGGISLVCSLPCFRLAVTLSGFLRVLSHKTYHKDFLTESLPPKAFKKGRMMA
jgi:hypothetical protein